MTDELFGTGRYAMNVMDGPCRRKSLEMEELISRFWRHATAPMPEKGRGGFPTSVLSGEDISIFNRQTKTVTWKFMKFIFTNWLHQEEMANA